MLKPKSPQASFYGSYLYDRIVPQDHLLRKINAVVDFSFVRELVKDRYTPDFGRPAEDPEFMLRLCLLQYIYDDSDRQVIENARMHNGYKYFLGLAIDEEVPDDTTISYFRAQRLGEEKFREVFQQIVQQCIDKGLVTGKRQIVDSTHIEADVTRNSLSGLIKLCRQNLLRTIEKQDAKTAEKLGAKEMQFTKQDKFSRHEANLEDEIAEAKTLMDGVTEELRKGTLKASPELVKDLGLIEKAVTDREQNSVDRLVSPVDPDARMGRKQSKSWAGYKGHVVVEEESEIITAVETTPANKADGNQLPSLLKQQEEVHSLKPGELSGDKAYDSGSNLELLDSKGIRGNISLTRKANHVNPDFFTVEDFHYENATETLTCPAGCLAPYHRRAVFNTGEQKRRGSIFQFSPEQCNSCNLREKCHKSKRGRAVYTSYYEPLFQQMRERMGNEEGRESYRKRYKIEHKIADLARYCGMRHCRYRGLMRAKIHTLLSAIASNVKRMARLLWKVTDPLLPERAVA
jgi:transposase